MKIIHETQTNLSHKTIHVLIDVIINFVEFIFFLLFSLSNKSINTCMYILPVEKNHDILVHRKICFGNEMMPKFIDNIVEYCSFYVV